MRNRLPLRLLAVAIERESNPYAPKIKLVFGV